MKRPPTTATKSSRRAAGRLVAEGFGEAGADFGPGEGADYGSDGAEKEAGDE